MAILLALAPMPIGATSSPLAAEPLPLQPVANQRLTDDLGRDDRIPSDRAALLLAIDRSLGYLDTPASVAAYQDYPVPGITRARVRRSLVRFRQLVQQTSSPEELQAAVRREFVFYRAAGSDGQGTVAFTGYYEPVFAASRTRTADYRYPLYRRPADFEQWQSPHPARADLEGRHGTGAGSPLAGSELAWLRDRLEAFLVHVQGSATLRFPDGSSTSITYHGKTDRPYASIGKELVADGHLTRDELSLPAVLAHFRSRPADLSRYLPRNESFVFFQEAPAASPLGTLSVPVTADRSIATDKSLMPPGALALIHTQIPDFDATGALMTPTVSRYVLDQDTGSAIRGAGRVDIFLGRGTAAGARAGEIDWTGELYYLIVSE
ncbi:murein transglycosylase A [Rubidibacter lacunae]|uniref:murein transglycosylase A n=1 Tax=Rubidibacter lacunae TaxID=582514 RepID=UPI0038CD9944